MVHFFFGSNGYQMKVALDALVLRVRKKHGEHAVERVDGESLELNQLLDVLQGATLFTPERLVIIRGASKNKPVWEALGDKLADVPESLQLVVVEASPDKRTRTFKALQKTAELHETKELSEPEAIRWLTTESRIRGGDMSGAVARVLVARAGIDQFRLSNELDKVLAQGVMTPEAVERLVEATPQANAFALLDAAMQSKPDVVRRLLAEAKITEDSYMLFGLLSSQVMLLSALVYGKGRSSGDIAKALKTNPYPLQKLSPIAQRISLSELRDMVNIVAELDDRTKSSGIDPWLLLEQALMKIAAR